jgi:hypothetical protein
MPTKYPPALAVNEAIFVVEDMYKKHQSREVAIDLMPEIVGVKPSSSNFPASISALQKFGLVKKLDKDILELTDLAMQIINPIGDEKSEAIISIFEKTDVLSDLYHKFGKTSLPSPEQLKQSLLKSYGVERDTVEKWYGFVVDSFKALKLVEKSLATTSGEQPTQKVQTQPVNTQLFKIPMPSGKTFEFRLEDGHTAEDLDYVIGFFELMKGTKSGKK